ncbi:MAG TPA: phosphopentomutase [Actinomycetota bacterium]|nr:phosphopentomutase [Actinomycetota bacterium]
MNGVERVALVMCDSLGVGAAPDAAAYGDEGSDTVGNTARAVGGLDLPNLGALGLGHLTDVAGVPPAAEPGTAHGRLTERSAGKDSTTGHWEVAGMVLDDPFPTYPDGFPPEVIEPFEEAIGVPVLGNRPASGTDIIEELGPEHLRTGQPIVYTSGDSVFQVATHVDVVPLARLYEWCEVARGILAGPHRVGRVIARPFAGEPGSFLRTPDRRDYAVEPPGPTLLDRLQEAGVAVFGVGKIGDIFVERGLTESSYSRSNDHGVDLTLDYLQRTGPVFVMSNLVDFDSKYGHRNDPEGYARCLEAFDRRVPELRGAVGEGLLFVSGDHGCDPTTPPTDHSRERVPMLAAGARGPDPVDVGDRECFGDLGVSIAEAFGASTEGLVGKSFAGMLG